MAVLSILKGATRWRGARRLWLLGVICLALSMLGGCEVFKKKQDGEMTLVQMRFFGSYNDRLIMGYHQKKARGWNVCGLVSYDLSKQKVLQVYPSAEGYCMETPVVSYDNEWIAFGYYQQGRDDYLEQIGIMRADGSDWRLLTDTDSYKAHPSFSADGKKLIFLSARSKQRKGRKIMIEGLDAWELEIATGNLRQLTNIYAYGMSPPRYVPGEEGRFLISPEISTIAPLKSETYYTYKEARAGLVLAGGYGNAHKSKEGGRVFSGTIIDGNFYTGGEIREISRSNADIFESKYGNNFIFILDDKGDISQEPRSQPHDFSEPLFSMYKKRDLAADGEPYVNPDYRYYARDPMLDKEGEIMVYRGGDLFDKDDVYMYDMISEEVTQLTDGASNEFVAEISISSDGKYILYKALIYKDAYGRGDSKKLSALPVGSYRYRILNLETLKEIEINSQEILAIINNTL